MKKLSRKLFIYSCTSLATLSACAAYAQEAAYAPTLEGGWTASVGTFYVIPDSASQEFASSVTEINGSRQKLGQGHELANPVNNNGEYDFGIEATLGYVFEDTANSIELSWRGFDADSDAATSGLYIIPDISPDSSPEILPADVSNTIKYDLDSADLMITQFLNIGENMQLRLLGGLAFLYLDQKNNTTYDIVTPAGQDTTTDFYHNANSKYQGFGPRLGLDTRYDFGQGFGIVGGGSVAYFLGELETTANTTVNFESIDQTSDIASLEDNIDSHTVVNLRANLGIDYVYFFDNEERSTVGLELGYLVDYYLDAVNQITGTNSGNGVFCLNGCSQIIDNGVTTDTASSELSSVSFSGPYLNLKGTF